MEEMRRSKDQVKRICVLKATDTVKGEGRHEDEWSRERNAWDDVSGQALDKKEVEVARQKELGCIRGKICGRGLAGMRQKGKDGRSL